MLRSTSKRWIEDAGQRPARRRTIWSLVALMRWRSPASRPDYPHDVAMPMRIHIFQWINLESRFYRLGSARSLFVRIKSSETCSLLSLFITLVVKPKAGQASQIAPGHFVKLQEFRFFARFSQFRRKRCIVPKLPLRDAFCPKPVEQCEHRIQCGLDEARSVLARGGDRTGSRRSSFT